MALKSRICDILGIKYPILLAGMGGASVPRLAAAVSNAGGLGVLGAAACSPEQLREWIEEVRSLTDKPFGVDTLLPASVRRGSKPQSGGGDIDPMEVLSEYKAFARDFMDKEGLDSVGRSSIIADMAPIKGSKKPPQVFSKEFFDAQMQVVIEEKVPVYAAGLGNPGPWMDQLHANGTKVMAVVGAVKHAVQVVSSGIDLIVAQGHDGGGHNSPIGTMALIPQVVDAVAGRIPVLGAGGISDGRGIAAAFMLGAEGAWIGTTFLATEEAGIEDYQKEVIAESGDGDTVVSRSVTGKPARIIKNKWSQAWIDEKKEPL
ncbi:MAG: nitronate monooxygenase, partial [Parvibaculum sp.]